MRRHNTILLPAALIATLAARADADVTPTIVLEPRLVAAEETPGLGLIRAWINVADNPQLLLGVCYRAVQDDFYRQSDRPVDQLADLRARQPGDSTLHIIDVQPRRGASGRVGCDVSATLVRRRAVGRNGLEQTDLPVRFVVRIEAGTLRSAVARIDEPAARQVAIGSAMAESAGVAGLTRIVSASEGDIAYAVTAPKTTCLVALTKADDDGFDGWRVKNLTCRPRNR